MKLYVKKIMSKKGSPFIAIVGEDVFGQCFITFDTQVIMRMCGMSPKEFGDLNVGDSICIGDVG